MKPEGIFCDLDGTLMTSRLGIGEKTRALLRELSGEGVLFAAVTSRSPKEARPFLNGAGLVCPLISLGGALLEDETGRVMLDRALSRGQAEAVRRFLMGNGFRAARTFYSFSRWIAEDPEDGRIKALLPYVPAPPEKGALPEKIHRILLLGERQELVRARASLSAAFPFLSASLSWDTMLEITARGAGKAQALRFLCRERGVAPENCAAFGDNWNDLSMLRAVGYGFLMGNAPEELKRVFPRVTADNDREGIFSALSLLGAARG